MNKRLIILFIVLTASVATWAAQWSAKWIQAADNKDSINTWQIFKKSVHLNDVPENVTARIAVDSKYWLWVNGKQVVFEGGLKRGPSPKDTYFDEVDIAPYLKKGSNTIALLTVFFGKEGFSHKNSGHGALLFEAQAGKTKIISDESWEAAVYKAYGPSPIGDCPKATSALTDAKVWATGKSRNTAANSQKQKFSMPMPSTKPTANWCCVPYHFSKNSV